jgi:broad specificity phosphatase PhoE
MRAFLGASRVFSSPLTRALQTALVALEGHPALSSSPSLYASMREFKGLGGVDSVGIEVGEGILRRTRQELGEILGPERAEALTAAGRVDVNDCEQQWWTPIHSFDDKHECQERLLDFLATLRYSDGESPIFVGHSLFFKGLVQSRISKMLEKNRPILSGNLQRHRLANATVLALTAVFPDDQVNCDEAVLLDADVLFGGGFHFPAGAVNVVEGEAGSSPPTAPSTQPALAPKEGYPVMALAAARIKLAGAVRGIHERVVERMRGSSQLLQSQRQQSVQEQARDEREEQQQSCRSDIS